MAKLTLTDIQNIYGNSTAAEQAINNNFAAIEQAIENTLSRDGTIPNQIGVNLDMDENRITNLAPGINGSDAATVSQLQSISSPQLDLDDLVDVAITGNGAVVGDTLTFNGLAWVNTPLSALGGVNVLNDLQDTVVSAPQDQQALIYNGTEARWENTTIPSGVTDHGLLSGLTDDDHPQYLTLVRGNTYYPSIAVTITGTGSVSGGGTLAANRTLSLVNDSTAPGASRYYGTNASSTKGWFPLPSPSTDHSTLTNLGADDHPQYLNTTRGNALYATVGHTHTNYPTKNAADTITGSWSFSSTALPYVASAGPFIYHGSSSMVSGKITVSSSPPSGGSDGDIWFVVV
jgi:hypothetical protein